MLLVNPLPGDRQSERNLIKLLQLHFDVWKIVLAEACPYHSPAVVRLAFQAGQSQLFAVL